MRRPQANEGPDTAIGEPAARLAVLAAGALLLGLAVYLTDRLPGSALLIPDRAALRTGPLFGPVGAWLPSFAHVVAFSLLTAAAWPRHGRPRYEACALWWLLDVAFELGQRREAAGPIAEAVHRVLGEGPAATALARYFVLGRFDAADIVATTAGAIAAAAALHALQRQRAAS